MGELVILREKYNRNSYYFVAEKTDNRYKYLTGALHDRKDAEKKREEIRKIYGKD